MSRGHAGVQQPEKAAAMLAVQYVFVQQRVQLGVKIWIVDVLLGDKVEDAAQCEKCSASSSIEGVREEVCEGLDLGDKPGKNLSSHHIEDLLAVVGGQR